MIAKLTFNPRRWFGRVVLSRPWLSFVVMCLAFFAFGIGTLNLFYLLRANANLVLDNGWQALMDGALEQLFELLVNGFVAMAAYVVFKACEYRLVHWLGDSHRDH
ncbi:MAG: hypothetical protein HY021_14440 [Burkholderiales bacterium]|nr:hypothetical protein [Burkholderiales bacterium]